jgi:hypothetical protein
MAKYLEILVMKSKTKVCPVMMMTRLDGMAKNMVGKELVPRKLMWKQPMYEERSKGLLLMLERFIMLTMFEIMA